MSSKCYVIWMDENQTTRWSTGCYFVQWQKNISYHRIIGRSPYKSLYGADPKVDLQSTNLSSELIDKMVTEEDLENVTENIDSEGASSLSNYNLTTLLVEEDTVANDTNNENNYSFSANTMEFLGDEIEPHIED